MNTVKLEIPLLNEVMTTVRLTTGGVCSLAGLSFDDGEDCKVCVTESLLLLQHGGFRRALLVFEDGDTFACRAEGLGETAEPTDAFEDEISAALVQALAEDVVMEKTDGLVRKISFHFGKSA